MRLYVCVCGHVCVCVRAYSSLFSRTNINHRIGYGSYMCLGPTINGLRARQNGSPVDPVFFAKQRYIANTYTYDT